MLVRALSKSRSWNLALKFKLAGKPEPKGQPAAPPAPTPIPEITRQELIADYLKPMHSPLSPSEQEYLASGFDDLTSEEKVSIDRLADVILGLNTSVFFQLDRNGGLGTGPALYVASQKLEDEQIREGVQRLRKEL